MKREFTVVIGCDEDGIYVASAPELVGCHTQVKTLDELRKGITEVVQLYLEGDQNLRNGPEALIKFVWDYPQKVIKHLY